MKMPIEEIETTMFAPCGMNCKVCYKHCDHKKPCAGCLNQDTAKPVHCRKCKMKECLQNKGLFYCFECLEYPCKMITALDKTYRKKYQASLIDNNKIVQKHGVEQFMKQQKNVIPVQSAAALFQYMIKDAANAV